MQKRTRRQTTLALLRKVLGLTQKQLCDYVECPIHWIKAIEAQRIRMSEDLARKISWQTGVDRRWLRQNDAKAPLINARGRPYSIADFRNAQAFLPSPIPDESRRYFGRVVLAELLAVVGPLFVCARDGGQLERLYMRIFDMIGSLGKEFHADPGLVATLLKEGSVPEDPEAPEPDLLKLVEGLDLLLCDSSGACHGTAKVHAGKSPRPNGHQ